MGSSMVTWKHDIDEPRRSTSTYPWLCPNQRLHHLKRTSKNWCAATSLKTSARYRDRPQSILDQNAVEVPYDGADEVKADENQISSSPTASSNEAVSQPRSVAQTQRNPRYRAGVSLCSECRCHQVGVALIGSCETDDSLPSLLSAP